MLDEVKIKATSGSVRRRNCQEFLLDAYQRVGKRHAAIMELISLWTVDRQKYVSITGSDRLLKYETVLRYWKQIPPSKRASARQAFEAEGNQAAALSRTSAVQAEAISHAAAGGTKPSSSACAARPPDGHGLTNELGVGGNSEADPR